MTALRLNHKGNEPRTDSVVALDLPKIESLLRVELGQEPPVVVRFAGRLMGKERPRRNNNGSHFYTPTRTSANATLIGLEGRKAMRARAPMTGTIFARVLICVSVPKSWSALKKASALSGEILPRGKPDIDNQTKTLFDGLNGIVFADDDQIAGKLVVRRYAPEDAVIAMFHELP